MPNEKEDKKVENGLIEAAKCIPERHFQPDFDKKRKHPVILYCVIVFVGICVISGGVFTYHTLDSNNKKEETIAKVSSIPEITEKPQSTPEEKIYTVPYVVEKKEKTALKKLYGIKMNVKVKYSYSDVVEKGRVISQSVDAGVEVEKGQRITIQVSKGTKQIQTYSSEVNSQVTSVQETKEPTASPEKETKKKQETETTQWQSDDEDKKEKEVEEEEIVKWQP